MVLETREIVEILRTQDVNPAQMLAAHWLVLAKEWSNLSNGKARFKNYTTISV